MIFTISRSSRSEYHFHDDHQVLINGSMKESTKEGTNQTRKSVSLIWQPSSASIWRKMHTAQVGFAHWHADVRTWAWPSQHIREDFEHRRWISWRTHLFPLRNFWGGHAACYTSLLPFKGSSINYVITFGGHRASWVHPSYPFPNQSINQRLFWPTATHDFPRTEDL